MLITELLRRQPEKKICFIYDGECITYGQMEQSTSEMAAAAAAFIKKGDKVLLQESDPLRLLLSFWAIIKAGGICVPINSGMPEKTGRELMHRYQINIKSCFKDFFSGEKHELPGQMEENIFLGAMSSGSSTGVPKMILRDHKSWLAAFPWQSEVFNLGADDLLYLAGELSYTANLNACMHMFFAGGGVIMAKNKLPQTWLADMTEYGASAIFMVPAHYSVLLKAAKRADEKIRSLVTGGAKLDAAAVYEMRRRFPNAVITEYYGASELGHVSYAHASDLIEKPQSVGKLFPGVKVRIADGVVWVQSPYIVPEYQPEATAGDLGSIDADGYLTLFGRKNGAVNIGGVKIQPEQMEAELRKHPLVEAAAVFSVDDRIRGKKLAAAVVSRSDDMTLGDIIKYCRRNTGHYPQKIFFVKELPLNASGKVDRIFLRRMAEEGKL